MSIKIALAGNPNSGKTTMFNALTGSSQYVGNWPGVTVEKKEGKLKGNKEVIIQDLPGIYSLSPYTPEEVVSRNYLVQEKPDAIINIVDASNIERNLYLTTQLMDIGVPVVLALNMMDVVDKNGDKIDVDLLEKTLGCPVIKTAAVKNVGCMEAVQKAIELGKAGKKAQKMPFSQKVENALKQIEQSLAGKVEDMHVRWYAIKLFERDEKIWEQLGVDQGLKQKIEDIILACETALDDDSESVIINERYEHIGKIIGKTVHKNNSAKLTTSDKIDQVVTNRILALPIFVAIMFLVYFISISTVGTFMTDWVNEELFGEVIAGSAEELLESAGTAEWLSSLVVDGVIEGVGAVLGFLPQMLVLFFCLAILEDCGYMARIAFIMDRFFRRFGLSGKSFIPILVGTGCGVPGVMASRTIESERDRKITIMTTTFIPCAAKLPIIALIAGALFNNSAWVAASAYFLGIAAIIVSGIILKKTSALSGDAAPFVMELPQYRMPTLKGVLIHMWDRGKSFVKKAGTIIFLSCILIWFLTSFNFSLEMVDADESIMAAIAGVISPIFSPLGWGDWQSTVATITGLIAKENVVSTFAILFGFMEEVSEEGVEIWGTLATHYASGLAAYSFLAFNLLCAPCFAAIGAIHREMASVKWTLIAVGYQTGFAYVIALIIFQFGTLFTGGGFGFGTVLAFVFAALLLFLLFRPRPQNKQILKEIQHKA